LICIIENVRFNLAVTKANSLASNSFILFESQESGPVIEVF